MYNPSNINTNFVNMNNTNNPANFSSNETQQQFNYKNNIEAANASKMVGGSNYKSKKYKKNNSKNNKYKIKNIVKEYKVMKRGSQKMKSLKIKLKKSLNKRTNRYKRNSRSNKGKTNRYKSKTMRGGSGYAQFQNNMVLPSGYSVANTNLPSSQLALANPPPITALKAGVDNYNHFTGKGFPSRGN